jgi:hypothetical protein
MADPYIDQFETLAYGRFAVSQMLALLIGLDPELDPCVKIFANRLAADTDAMEAALAKSGALESVTYKSASGKTDVVAEARDVLRRVVRYAESRPDGAVLASRILQGESLTTVLRRRPRGARRFERDRPQGPRRPPPDDPRGRDRARELAAPVRIHEVVRRGAPLPVRQDQPHGGDFR